MSDFQHLDRALAEEFAGQAEAIHALKARDAHFAGLMERNHGLWKQIQNIQKGLEPVEDAVLEQLEKQRLHVLDEIATRLRAVGSPAG
jgi:uncharacterized protein YdcH (DUF465 family)